MSNCSEKYWHTTRTHTWSKISRLWHGIEGKSYTTRSSESIPDEMKTLNNREHTVSRGKRTSNLTEFFLLIYYCQWSRKKTDASHKIYSYEKQRRLLFIICNQYIYSSRPSTVAVSETDFPIGEPMLDNTITTWIILWKWYDDYYYWAEISHDFVYTFDFVDAARQIGKSSRSAEWDGICLSFGYANTFEIASQSIRIRLCACVCSCVACACDNGSMADCRTLASASKTPYTNKYQSNGI